MKLEGIYKPSGPLRKVSLYKKLLSFCMTDCSNMTEYLNKFTEITEKLAEVGIVLGEELIVIILLSSLPSEFENFVIAMETRDALPTFDVLKLKLIEEAERRIQQNEISNDSSVVGQQVFAARSSMRKKNNNNNNSCGSINNKKFKCYKCHKRGHFAKDCKEIKDVVERKENHRVFGMLAVFRNNDFNKKSWCIDSGATAHMCSERQQFSTFEKANDDIMLACDKYVKAEGKGDVIIETAGGKITLRNTLYVPGIVGNFISVAKATETGLIVQFKHNKAEIREESGEIILTAKKQGNLFIFSESLNKIFCLKNNEAIRWHNRYGHLNFRSLKNIVGSEAVNGIKIKRIPEDINCITCMKSKIVSQPFPKTGQKRVNNLLDLIHTDVCGPMNTSSVGGARYFLTFIDDNSRFMFVYFIKNKSEVFEKFKIYKSLVENQFGRKIKAIRSDNGREYINNQFNKFLEENGIQRQLSVPYTPQQNGIAERANRTIVEMARSMIVHAGVNEALWAEAVSTAVYIRNRAITAVLKNKTPFEIWYSKKPNVSHLRVFGCRAIGLDKTQSRKFSAKGKEYIFVGYSLTAKAYRLYDADKKYIVEKRDVNFYENINENTVLETDNNEVNTFDFVPCSIETTTSNVIHEESTESQTDEEEYESSTESEFIGFDDESDNKALEDQQQTMQDKTRGRGRPKLIRTGSVGRPRKVYKNNLNYFGETGEILIPRTYEEAISSNKSAKWKESMQKEFNSLKEYDTWSLVDLPTGKKPIGCKWVYNVKRNEHGKIERFKSRLVALGCSQEFGVNYNETFSPVIRYSTIRMMFALAVEKNLYLHHVDISTAYLNSELIEEVFMKQPKGFNEGNPNQVLRLKKAIYGLKQSGRAWNSTLDKALKDIGLKPCPSEPCLYRMKNNNKYILVAVYVDDILISCSNLKDLNMIKEAISKKFKLVDNGRVKHFLGMEIERDFENGKISVGHSQYIKNLLQEYNMESCRAAYTPLDPGFQIACANKKCERVNAKNYQSIIGTLMYLAISTRPDILHSVCKLAQRNQDPHIEHEKAVKHLLRYLSSTKDLKLRFTKTGKHPEGFVDADWASCTEDRKSYTGCSFFLAGCVFSWECKKQSNIALSSTEAEFVALSTAAKEAVYIKRLLNEINCYPENRPVTIYGDNLGAQHLAKNPVLHGRSKHIDVKVQHVREVVRANEIEIRYIPSDSMPADIFTKNLSKQKHQKFVGCLGLK